MSPRNQRGAELQSLERAGKINCLRSQVTFVLAPSVHIPGELSARPAIQYVAEFAYRKHGAQIIEDWKSDAARKLPAFRLKQHLMATVHGLEIRITA